MTVILKQTLALERPLLCIDVESTGPSVDNDRIVQISATKHYVDKDPITWKSLINPGVPIPREVQEVHGISDAMIAEAPKFADIAAQLAKTAMTNVDYLGQNVTFDLRILRSEFRRAGVNWDWERTDSLVIDTLRIRQVTQPNDLSTIYREVVGRELENAHDAAADVSAVEEILEVYLSHERFAKYQIPKTVKELAAFCWPQRPNSVDRDGKVVWRNGEACLGFGKFNGRTLSSLAQSERGYLSWLANKSDFPPDVKKIALDAMNGVFPKRNE